VTAGNPLQTDGAEAGGNPGRRPIDLSDTTIGRFPHGFVSKNAEPILITPVDLARQRQLVEMYLAYRPRNSFSGLPPLRDDACVRWVESMLATGINLVALRFEEGVAGHAALFPIDELTCEMFVVVQRPHQRVGIGTELTNCIVQLGRELGFERIALSVEAPNHVARHIYEKCGFQYHDRGLRDELHMTLDLARFRGITGLAVREIMNRHVVVLHPEMPCKVALMIFLEDGLESLPVTREKDELTGMLSQTDLMVEENIHKKVRDVQSRNVITVHESCPVAKVISLFRSRNLRCVPVLDHHGRLVGVVRRRDVLTYYLKRYADRRKT